MHHGIVRGAIDGEALPKHEAFGDSKDKAAKWLDTRWHITIHQEFEDRFTQACRNTVDYDSQSYPE